MADQIPQYSADDYTNLFKNPQFNALDINDQLSRLSQTEPAFKGWDADKYASFRKSLGVPLQGKLEAPTSLKDKIIETARPFVAPMVGAGVGLAAAPTGPLGAGTAGVGASILVDQALQAAEDRKPVTSLLPDSPIANTTEMLAGNEIGGRIGDRVLGGLGRMLSEYKVPGSIVNVGRRGFSELDPTYSQYFQKTFTSQPISKWVEDIFASGTKAAAIERSGQKGILAGIDLGKSITGRTVAVANKDWMAPSIQTDLQNSFRGSLDESNRLANTARVVAKANVTQLPISGATVEGPINLKTTAKLAQEFLDNNAKIYGGLDNVPPNDKHLVSVAQTLVRLAQPVVDPQTGDILRTTPISFNDAWGYKQVADTLGYGDPLSKTNFANTTFRKLARSINEDIDNSMPLWQNNPRGVATKAWQDAKAIVAQRNALFNEDGVKQLINETNSAVPAIDAILADPVKLQRALNAGELNLANGKVLSTNLRKDLQGYKLMTMLQDAWEGDPINPDIGRINPQKLSSAWQSFGQGDSKNLLFAKNSIYSQQNRADIDQLIKNIAMTQQKQSLSGLSSRTLWAIRGGLALAPGLITGSMTGSAEWGASVTAISLSGMAAARLLTNPKTARMLVAMSADQPVGRSTQFISRELVGALQGTGALITLNTKDGKKIQGTIDKDGKFTPSQP